MNIIPAVDILDGKVVRLFKGSFDEKKEYSNNPVEVAQYWQDQGAQYLHVVDLDGAKSGEPRSLEAIKEVIKSTTIPVEVGGGIRTLDTIKAYINLGADRVVLGTAVMEDLSFLDKEEIKGLIDKIAISYDVKKARDFDKTTSYVTTGTSGWLKEHKICTNELVEKMISANIRYLNYTDRSKDGTLEGLSDDNIKFLSSFFNLIKDIEVIYAGGIASLEDIKKLKDLENSGLLGVIVGKALYEKKFSLKEAQDIANAS